MTDVKVSASATATRERTATFATIELVVLLLLLSQLIILNCLPFLPVAAIELSVLSDVATRD